MATSNGLPEKRTYLSLCVFDFCFQDKFGSLLFLVQVLKPLVGRFVLGRESGYAGITSVQANKKANSQ